MPYKVIYADGREQNFYIREMAEMYARIYRGRVVGKPQLILVDKLAA
jgi:hypothetical protein